MKEIIITANDAGRRLDRFLRRYLPGASLSEIYRIIRKDVKVGGRRAAESYILNEGDVLSLYLSDDTLEKCRGAAQGSGAAARAGSGAKRTFSIVYEDDNVLIANKPYGLLTHGDSHEKKNHLANQVKDYLIGTGAYDPRSERIFSPAPVNRLDRNTTGLVIFGKTAEALRELTKMIRSGDIRKFYKTVACGEVVSELHLSDALIKNEAANKVRVVSGDAAGACGGARAIETVVRPMKVLSFGRGLRATLCEVELLTGRPHQIRAHLASAGHPLAGDSKYAGRSAYAVNRYAGERFGLRTQLLHACKLEFHGNASDYPALSYLAGRSFDCPLPERFTNLLKGLEK